MASLIQKFLLYGYITWKDVHPHPTSAISNWAIGSCKFQHEKLVPDYQAVLNEAKALKALCFNSVSISKNAGITWRHAL